MLPNISDQGRRIPPSGRRTICSPGPIFATHGRRCPGLTLISQAKDFTPNEVLVEPSLLLPRQREHLCARGKLWVALSRHHASRHCESRPAGSGIRRKVRAIL